MNRIILIGNGFDLAHGLKTSYKDFIDDFWERKKQKILSSIGKSDANYRFIYEDEYIDLKTNYEISDLFKTSQSNNSVGYQWYENLSTSYIRGFFHGPNIDAEIFCKNNFLERISKKNSLQDWVDIEEEYYSALVECQKTNGDIKKLNDDFQCIQDALQTYLLEQNAINITIKDLFRGCFYSDFLKDDFIQFPSIDKIEKVDKVLFLNFNYTSIIARHTYANYNTKLINIHGELKNNKNPIIFGYGDEIDDNFKFIENMKINEYLKYFKSFHYSRNNNYRDMLTFINADEYQIYIMGLSCGTSDRTLLHTLFEHKHCKSIKIFYHKENEEVDNYLDIYMNMSRNFTNKEKMRGLIVSKENSLPMPQGI